MKRWMILHIIAIAAVFSACSHANTQSANINEQWLARVPQADLAPVNQARAVERQAEDEANRAKAGVTDANNQLDIAKADQDTAKSQVAAAEAQFEAAKDSGDQARVQEDQAALDHSKAAKEAADAKVDYAEANLKAANTNYDLAKARVQTQKSKVEYSEYQVLQQNGDTRVRDMQPEEFQSRIQSHQAEESRLKADLTREQQATTAARQKWTEARSNLQASQPTPPTG